MHLTSKQIEREDGDVNTVAGRLPTSWKEAVASWLDMRQRQLTAGLLDVKDFEAKTTVLHTYALQAMSAYLGANLKQKPTVKVQAPTKDAGRHYITLASLLCPANWEQTIKPVLDTLAETATQEILGSERVAMPCLKIETKLTPEVERYRAVVGEKQALGLHQAIVKETRRFVRFMQSVEARGAEAQAKLERGLGPTQRRGTLVRAM